MLKTPPTINKRKKKNRPTGFSTRPPDRMERINSPIQKPPNAPKSDNPMNGKTRQNKDIKNPTKQHASKRVMDRFKQPDLGSKKQRQLYVRMPPQQNPDV